MHVDHPLSRDQPPNIRHFVNTATTSSCTTMRLDEREIPGASDRIEDAPDLTKIRTSNRGLVPKREWPEVEASKPRKKRRVAPQSTPSTQTSTQNSTQISSASFAIYEDEPPESSRSIDHSTKRTKQKHHQEDWEVEYQKLKKKSTQAARDYLVQLIGQEDYPEVLRVPVTQPKVLLDCPFDPNDPLAVFLMMLLLCSFCRMIYRTA